MISFPVLIGVLLGAGLIFSFAAVAELLPKHPSPQQAFQHDLQANLRKKDAQIGELITKLAAARAALMQADAEIAEMKKWVPYQQGSLMRWGKN